MSSPSLSKTFTNALITTTIGQLPQLLQTGGKALLQQLLHDPINIGGISTVVQIFGQAVLPDWANNAHAAWRTVASRGFQSIDLAHDLGIDVVSKAQTSLAESEGFSQAVFIISNLVASEGIPKIAQSFTQLENPKLDTTLGDEGFNVVTSMYSSSAVHREAQLKITQLTDRLELMVTPLYGYRGPVTERDMAFDIWACGKTPDPTGRLKYKLLMAVMAVTRFGTKWTPIQFPIVLNQLSYIATLAVLFGLRLTCEGIVLVEGERGCGLDLIRRGDFKEGEEIIMDIQSLVANEKIEGQFEYLNFRDLRVQAKFDLKGASTRQLKAHFKSLRRAATVELSTPCLWEEATCQAADAVVKLMARVEHTLRDDGDGPEDQDIDDCVSMLFMLELLDRVIAGPVAHLGVLIEDPYVNLASYRELVHDGVEGAQDWSEKVWQFLRALNPHAQMDLPFATIIGGQSGVLVPSLLVVKTTSELLGCSMPLTLIEGVLSVRGKRQDLLNEAMPGVSTPLLDDEVPKVSRPKCIWRNVERVVRISGANRNYFYKVYAEQFRIDIGLATLSWMRTTNGPSHAAIEAIDRKGRRNAPDYVCRNVNSTKLDDTFQDATIWLTHKSLAGKLLVLTTLSDLTDGIYVVEDESMGTARKSAYALDIRHILL